MASPTTEPVSTVQPLQLLWAGIQRKEYQSLTNLYRLLYNDLLNFGLMQSHDAASTKDAINQIFLEIWEKADRLMPVENVRSYLLTYLRRKLLRDYERGIRHTELADGEQAKERSYEEVIVEAQQEEYIKKRLRAALDQLTPRQKELIELRFFEGLTNEAISQQTGMHINTVYNTMSAALKILRQQMTHEPSLSFSAWLPYLVSGSASPFLAHWA